MPDPDASAARYAVERTEREAGALLALLARERQVLAGRALADLEAVTAEKDRLIASLEGAARTAHRALAEPGPEPHSGDGAVGDPPAPPALARAWRRCLDAIDRCQQENRTNGAIVRTLERSTRHSLELVHHATGSGESVYGRAGETRRISAHRYSTSA